MCPSANHLMAAKSVARMYLPFTDPLGTHVPCRTSRRAKRHPMLLDSVAMDT